MIGSSNPSGFNSSLKTSSKGLPGPLVSKRAAPPLRQLPTLLSHLHPRYLDVLPPPPYSLHSSHACPLLFPNTLVPTGLEHSSPRHRWADTLTSSSLLGEAFQDHCWRILSVSKVPSVNIWRWENPFQSNHKYRLSCLPDFLFTVSPETARESTTSQQPIYPA